MGSACTACSCTLPRSGSFRLGADIGTTQEGTLLVALFEDW